MHSPCACDQEASSEAGGMKLLERLSQIRLVGWLFAAIAILLAIAIHLARNAARAQRRMRVQADIIRVGADLSKARETILESQTEREKLNESKLAARRAVLIIEKGKIDKAKEAGAKDLALLVNKMWGKQ